MSSSSTNISLSTIGSDAGIPNLNVATIPENIRNGDSKAKQAYSEGLAFENILVSELTQQLASTMYGGSDSTDGSSSDGSSDSSDGSSGSSMLGGASAYASMIPQALSSSIMDSGGLGMASSFAQELDPSLLSQASGTTSTSAAGATDPTSSSVTSSGATDQSSATGVGAAREASS